MQAGSLIGSKSFGPGPTNKGPFPVRLYLHMFQKRIVPGPQRAALFWLELELLLYTYKISQALMCTVAVAGAAKNEET